MSVLTKVVRPLPEAPEIQLRSLFTDGREGHDVQMTRKARARGPSAVKTMDHVWVGDR